MEGTTPLITACGSVLIWSRSFTCKSPGTIPKRRLGGDLHFLPLTCGKPTLVAAQSSSPPPPSSLPLSSRLMHASQMTSFGSCISSSPRRLHYLRRSLRGKEAWKAWRRPRLCGGRNRGNLVREKYRLSAPGAAHPRSTGFRSPLLLDQFSQCSDLDLARGRC